VRNTPRGNNCFLLFPFSQLLGCCPGHCCSLQQHAGMSSSLLNCSRGIPDQPHHPSPCSPSQRQQLWTTLPLFKSQPIAKVGSAVPHCPDFTSPGDVLARKGYGVTDVPALLAHREMIYFSMQERSLFCIILARTHHWQCTMKVIFLSWALLFIVKWNFISICFISQFFSIIRASATLSIQM